MITKNDLAKQFELVVQQEIKNHNDAVLACNLKIDDFRKRLDVLNDADGKIRAELSSNITRLEIMCQNLRHSLDNLTISITKSLGEIKRCITESSLASKDIINANIALSVKQKESCERIDKIESYHENLDKRLTSIAKKTSDELERQYYRYNDEYKKFRDEALEKPKQEADSVKNVLEKSLMEKACDIKGIKEDITGMRHIAFVTEKKIENIYTLIERLSRRIDGCLKPE